VSQRTPVARAVVTAPEADVARLRSAADDLRATGRVGDLRLVAGGAEVSVSDVDLQPEESAS